MTTSPIILLLKSVFFHAFFYLIFLGEGRAGIQHEVPLAHGVPGSQLPIRGTWRMRKQSVFTAADLERRGITEQAFPPGGRKEMLSIWADQ